MDGFINSLPEIFLITSLNFAFLGRKNIIFNYSLKHLQVMSSSGIVPKTSRSPPLFYGASFD